MDQKKTGRFLKQLRSEKNMTQEQLAQRFNVSNRSVSRWETGSNLPDISLLVEIADFYDVDVREIIDGERKSKTMDKELKEVADKMADYQNNEKRSRYRWIQVIGIVGVFVSLIALILQIVSYEPGIASIYALFASFATMVIMTLITLYVTGLLKKISQSRKAMMGVNIAIIISIIGTAYVVAIGYIVITLLGINFALSGIHVSTDPSEYHKDIHNPKGEYSYGNIEELYLLPDNVEELDLKDYQVTYYNPWDPQYVVYFTVDYDEGAYETEMERLKDLGISPNYTDCYSVTGEPEDYDIVAMQCNDYYGFVYAMIPEGKNDNHEITYVALWFCNYEYDLNVHKYIPDEYLLPGFDATSGNPYRKQQMDE